MDFFAVKIDGSDVTVGTPECLNIPTFSADKIYYNFSQEYPKITNI